MGSYELKVPPKPSFGGFAVSCVIAGARDGFARWLIAQGEAEAFDCDIADLNVRRNRNLVAVNNHAHRQPVDHRRALSKRLGADRRNARRQGMQKNAVTQRFA